uniref:Uncharacterized protein n=1 Tax=Zea mays TaxID=4577 RepID=A0A804M0W0_MAIZE
MCASYGRAVKVDPYDAGLFSSRSLCWLHAGDGKRALQDAARCKMLRPKWAKGYYRHGQALMLLKEYEKACDTLSEGLELDPMCDELEKLYWEAMELKNGRALGRRFPFWLMSPGNTRKKHSVVCSFGGCWTVFSTSPSM